MTWLGRLGIALLLLVVLGSLTWNRFLRVTTVPEPWLSGQLVNGSLTWEERERVFRAYVPEEVDARPALVIVLHGSMGDGDQARAGFAFGFDRLADEHGFIAVYPTGYDNHWNGCRKAGPYAANEQDVDDVGFLGALADHFATERGADSSRVFVTGISNGGHMALRMALEAPERVRAVAPVVASLPAGDNLGCEKSGRPVSILLMNGTADPMNPYEGGTVALYGLLGNRGEVLSTEETIRYWAELAGHTRPGETVALADVDPTDESTVERTLWRSPGREDVMLYSVRGGGHTVPHPTQRMPRLLGPTNGDLDAADEIWAFFDALP